MDATSFDLGQHRGEVGFSGGDLPGELTGPHGQRVVSHLGDLVEERRRHSTTLLGDHTGRSIGGGEHVFESTESACTAQAERPGNH